MTSDAALIKFGVTKKVTDLLDTAGFAYSVYSDIKPNPTIENVQNGVAAFQAAEADCIIAIGGGSSMDTAKAIGIIIENPEFADVRSLEGVAPTKKHAVFTIAVPTTAGTAAEVTINYVITDVEKKRKFVCVDTNDIPEVAVVRKLSSDVGIPANLKGILKEEDILFLSESAYADAYRPGNPRDTSVEEIVELYRSQL